MLPRAVPRDHDDSTVLPLTISSIRLATHLYAEHLLDRDHYMDWLVSGLENSNQAKLPLWLLIIQIYWKDILKLRRHGRRLVNAILFHHSSVRPLNDKLQFYS